MNEVIYQLKVTLKESKPLIWRRFQVPGNASLHKLHRILQTVMGWTNSHLYRFEINEIEYGMPDPEDDFYELHFEDSSKVRLVKVLPFEKDRFTYEYDFGDSWQHDILIEKILPVELGANYPICLFGKRACPPEDCGGIWGYSDLLRIIRKPKDEEYERMMYWLGGSFDPEKFDLDGVNKSLTRFHQSTRPKKSASQQATEIKNGADKRILDKISRNNKQKQESKLQISTVCYYVPDDKTPTKAAVGIVNELGKEPVELKRWWGRDVIRDLRIQAEIADFIKAHNIGNVAITDGVIGCPHEEGLDFPTGEDCPYCPFWRGKQ